MKTFQDNWDIEAPDFSDMLQRSLDKVDNLLENRWDWPAPFLKDAVKVYPEDVRAMFRVLFSEDGAWQSELKIYVNGRNFIRQSQDIG